MDMDRGKLFVGGIGWDTTLEQLKEHFMSFGKVANVSIVKDKTTGQPRGFGFVSFSDASVLDRVLQSKHVIGDRTVDVKQALSKELHNTPVRTANTSVGMNPGGGMSFRTKKIFVGGLPPTLTEDEFREYFGSYGSLTDVVIMYDQVTHRARGFGFVSYESEDAADKVLNTTFHQLNGKTVEVKRAQPKDAAYTGNVGSRVSNGWGYHVYGSSAANVSGFAGQIMSNRFSHPQDAMNRFPSNYGFGAPAYFNYGGFGGYDVGHYGFGSPMGTYQTPTMPIGYGTMGFGGGPFLRNPVHNGPVHNGVGYGSQGYGLGGYLRNDFCSFNGQTAQKIQSGNTYYGGRASHGNRIFDPSKVAGRQTNINSGQISAEVSNLATSLRSP